MAKKVRKVHKKSVGSKQRDTSFVNFAQVVSVIAIMRDFTRDLFSLLFKKNLFSKIFVSCEMQIVVEYR